MTIWDGLSMLGGLCLFLFGMNIMGQALERRTGDKLRSLLGKMTNSRTAGFLTGCGVTAVIQSSSATTVMVIGFVNSGIMTLKQAINVIMGANVGTTVTSWILSLGGISSDTIWVKMLKPSSFTPILAFVGILYYMFSKNSKKNDTGMILLGFATLMFGMETMTKSVSGLAEIPAFQNIFVMFENPILGVLAGAFLTALIQSSTASVGILQALAATGQVSYSAAIPIIMGQNIGTCITALLSSVGANKNAKRAAFIHLSFNVIGTAAVLAIFLLVRLFFTPVFLAQPASLPGIAVTHTIFNFICVLILLPLSNVLEKLALRVITDSPMPEDIVQLDERLLVTPSLALEQCRSVASDMAQCSARALKNGLQALSGYTPDLIKKIQKDEEACDRYEDALSTFLVKVSASSISDTDSEEAAKLLKLIGDFERISDHAVNLLESAEELKEKELTFSDNATKELQTLCSAVSEIMDLSLHAFIHNSLDSAHMIVPLGQVIDGLKEQFRTHHIRRMQKGNCSIEVGFVWSDLLTNLKRTSDHCSNIAGCVIDTARHNLNLHETLRASRTNNKDYDRIYQAYAEKYAGLL